MRIAIVILTNKHVQLVDYSTLATLVYMLNLECLDFADSSPGETFFLCADPR